MRRTSGNQTTELLTRLKFTRDKAGRKKKENEKERRVTRFSPVLKIVSSKIRFYFVSLKRNKHVTKERK